VRSGLVHASGEGSRTQVVGVLSDGIEVLARAGCDELGAVVAGAVGNPLREMYIALAGREHESQERAIQALRDRLGADRCAAVSARGAAMSYDEIVEYALAELDRLIAEAEPEAG